MAEREVLQIRFSFGVDDPTGVDGLLIIDGAVIIGSSIVTVVGLATHFYPSG